MENGLRDPAGQCANAPKLLRELRQRHHQPVRRTAPEALDIQTISGNIDLSLPEDVSFTLEFHSTSGELSSDLPYRAEEGRYIFGNGEGEYKIGTVSGDVRITAEK